MRPFYGAAQVDVTPSSWRSQLQLPLISPKKLLMHVNALYKKFNCVRAHVKQIQAAQLHTDTPHEDPAGSTSDRSSVTPVQPDHQHMHEHKHNYIYIYIYKWGPSYQRRAPILLPGFTAHVKDTKIPLINCFSSNKPYYIYDNPVVYSRTEKQGHSMAHCNHGWQLIAFSCKYLP
jgi:hypothetical protein